jgi:hypothetical protein
MWIASTSGFFSIVQHRDFPDQFIIRARVKKDLESIVDSSKILSTPEADYRYRVILKKEEVATIYQGLLSGIDYPNFKNAVASNPFQKDKLSAYHKIWQVMWEYASKPFKV